jgi:hypothetical protein
LEWRVDLSRIEMIATTRWAAVLILVAGAAALSERGWSETAPATAPAVASVTVEQWQTTDRSMLDFVEDGYDLISVIPASSQARIYFLSKPGKIVKCREDATPNGPPPIPPLPPTPGRECSYRDRQTVSLPAFG